MFFTNFVISLLLPTFTIIVILLIKKIFQKQLSAKWHYNLWFLLLFALAIPFLPEELLPFDGHFIALDSIESNENRYTIDSGEVEGERENWMKDFSVSVNRSSPDFLINFFVSLWMTGMLFMGILTIKSWYKLKTIKKTTQLIQNKELLLLFEQCKQQLKLTKPFTFNVSVRESPVIKSPLAFGLFKPYIVLPTNLDQWLTTEEIKYILLHELHHLKNKDVLTNYFVIIFQILYWYHPLVWFSFREMRLDREIACDTAVLNSMGGDCAVDYGNTILNFAEKTSKLKNLALANHLNGSKKHIKKRIINIAGFTQESKLLKLKSILIFLMVGIILSCQLPFVSAMASGNDQYKFNHERVTYEDLSTYFKDDEGSFVLYDAQADSYRIYNKNQSTLRVSPNSTYKIYSALFGMEANTITSENSTIKWDGEDYPFDSWNRDHNLYTAMANSVNWYFQELDKSMPLDKIQENLKGIHYGNYDVSAGKERYWMESSLKISPVEQVQLLKAFYFNEFGFEEKNVQAVKDSLRIKELDDFHLSGKTGTGMVNGENINGWFIGYVENGVNIYFFATNIQNDTDVSGSKAVDITLSILNDKGIFKDE
ncbi:BlaR1 family beta-lactam sensor/signal transducer [Oceanobacillus sp. AG]|uniref:BlaR1 family beta-lactam sensor/signal transducer n=1 Tax=Oceanobacillus sp. AG TaxID=2681969 RepID=UPI0018DB3076|nr:BlaR1 family beta-lactam sensor/signal transducer [Oceanobacillus sp. AG]